MAEQQHGRPVFIRDVYQIIPQLTSLPIVRLYPVFMAILDLYANDQLLADKTCD